MVRAISSAIENRAFLNNSKAIGSWMAIMALSPSTAGTSRWHHPLLMGIILHYLNQATQHWDTIAKLGALSSHRGQRLPRLSGVVPSGIVGATLGRKCSCSPRYR